MQEIRAKINCPIFLAKENLVMKDLILRFDQSVNAEEREAACEELVGEIESTIKCKNFNPRKLECWTCLRINKRRKKKINEDNEKEKNHFLL